jgi:hypothetical protein
MLYCRNNLYIQNEGVCSSGNQGLLASYSKDRGDVNEKREDHPGCIIVIILAIYGMLMNNVEIFPYLIFILGSISLLRGISEIYLKRITYAIIFILTSGYIFFVLFQIIQ